jgi:hypothetical protein
MKPDTKGMKHDLGYSSYYYYNENDNFGAYKNKFIPETREIISQLLNILSLHFPSDISRLILSSL